jgi:hypothetical protein
MKERVSLETLPIHDEHILWILLGLFMALACLSLSGCAAVERASQIFPM